MKLTFTLVFAVFLSLNSWSQTADDCSCCSEAHTAFDFWIGEWRVTTADGSYAGTNTIDKVQDKCVIRENWTSATPGYTGTSYNFYNSQTKQWEQLWIDNRGQSLHMKGNRVGNQMILRTDDQINDEGKTFYHRITWTANADDSVRQLWETVVENKEISIAFDGIYRRKE